MIGLMASEQLLTLGALVVIALAAGGASVRWYRRRVQPPGMVLLSPGAPQLQPAIPLRPLEWSAASMPPRGMTWYVEAKAPEGKVEAPQGFLEEAARAGHAHAPLRVESRRLRLPQADRTVTKLQFSAQPVQSVASFVALGQGQFAIPPNTQGYSATATLTAAASTRVYGVLPHMHTLGRSIRVENTSSRQCYVNIPRWDFHWQQLYFFAQPIQVAAQSTIKLTCTWDNYSSRTVTWGEGTEDEMCLNYFYVTVP